MAYEQIPMHIGGGGLGVAGSGLGQTWRQRMAAWKRANIEAMLSGKPSPPAGEAINGN